MILLMFGYNSTSRKAALSLKILPASHISATLSTVKARSDVRSSLPVDRNGDRRISYVLICGNAGRFRH